MGINIKNNDIYKIEINDSGEFLEFDLNDVNLEIKGYKAIEKIDNLYKEIAKQQNELLEKSKTEEIDLEKEFVFLKNDVFKKMRIAMDEFLGNGACQKIFGDKNYDEMFFDLFDELNKPREELNGKSHFEMMRQQTKSIQDRIAQKYNINSKKVI